MWHEHTEYVVETWTHAVTSILDENADAIEMKKDNRQRFDRKTFLCP